MQLQLGIVLSESKSNCYIHLFESEERKHARYAKPMVEHKIFAYPGDLVAITQEDDSLYIVFRWKCVQVEAIEKEQIQVLDYVGQNYSILLTSDFREKVTVGNRVFIHNTAVSDIVINGLPSNPKKFHELYFPKIRTMYGHTEKQVGPTMEVLQAFGATENPSPMAGGQGRNYRSGNVVLKPAKDDEETSWIAAFYLSTQQNGFRLPKPIRSKYDGFVYGGWQAWEYANGRPLKGNWVEKIDLCYQFHQQVADVPKPTYFSKREQNPWVIADKVVWGEMDIEHHPRIAPAVGQLKKCLKPVNEPSQLIHGDFGGNILFSSDLDPIIIDFSPYWRPVAFAIGVVIADAIVWEGANESLIEAGNKFNNFYQHLARAELRRIIELETVSKLYGKDILNQIEAHHPLIKAICQRCR